jgi:DNA-binding response OmpR family regulator
VVVSRKPEGDARTRHRVLVVDDYPETAEVVCTLFELLGHETRCAYSGRSALAEAHAFEPDVVILDIGLSDLSGYEVAKQLRAHHTSKLDIIALTGWNGAERRRLALEAGCDQFVVKPCDAATLREILSAIDRRRAAVEPEPGPTQKSVPTPACTISGLTHTFIFAVPTSTVSNSGSSGVRTWMWWTSPRAIIRAMNLTSSRA